MSTRVLAGLVRLAPLAMAALLVGCPRTDPLPLLDSGAEGDASDVGTLDMPAVERDVPEVGVDVPPAPMDTGSDVPDVTDVLDVALVTDDGSIDTGIGEGGATDADVAETGPVDTGSMGVDVPDAGTADTGTPCAVGQQMCSGRCVTVLTDPLNCNGCGLTCPGAAGATATCVGGVCSFQCATGTGDCDAVSGNGCETNTTTAAAHCGRCGMACPVPANSAAVCIASSCGITCNAGFASCDGANVNGCETNLQTNAAHCGMCGRLCSGGMTCSGGACSCPSGQTVCAGTCRALQTDNRNCGACGNVCAAGTICSNGVCTSQCAPPTVDCSGVCRDRASDPNNCGACGTVCTRSNGVAGCSAGSCTLATCNAGFGDCDGNTVNGCETNTQTSSGHCGACGHFCTSSQVCIAGSCFTPCPSGMQFIPTGMFQMGDPSSDNPRAQPVHGVQLSAFCMDFTEVTVASWRSCNAPGCTVPTSGAGNCNWGVSGRDNHPINCVSWDQARAYCQWRGGDLPTEAQWEYAARGTEGRLFPWGSTPSPSNELCWSGVTNRSTTCPVAGFPTGATPLGLLDMAGNVAEWTADWYAAYTGTAGSYILNPTGPSSGTYRVTRGGAYGYAPPPPSLFVRTTIRFQTTPATLENGIGFRCVRAPN